MNGPWCSCALKCGDLPEEQDNPDATCKGLSNPDRLRAEEARVWGGYPVRLTKDEARLLMKLLTMQVDYPELEPEHQALYDKLEAVL